MPTQHFCRYLKKRNENRKNKRDSCHGPENLGFSVVRGRVFSKAVFDVRGREYLLGVFFGTRPKIVGYKTIDGVQCPHYDYCDREEVIDWIRYRAVGKVTHEYEYESDDGGRRFSQILAWDYDGNKGELNRKEAVDIFGEKTVSFFEERLKSCKKLRS